MELQGKTGTKFLSGIELSKGSIAYSEKDLHEDLFTCPLTNFSFPEWNLTELDSCESSIKIENKQIFWKNLLKKTRFKAKIQFKIALEGLYYYYNRSRKIYKWVML